MLRDGRAALIPAAGARNTQGLPVHCGRRESHHAVKPSWRSGSAGGSTPAPLAQSEQPIRPARDQRRTAFDAPLTQLALAQPQLAGPPHPFPGGVARGRSQPEHPDQAMFYLQMSALRPQPSQGVSRQPACHPRLAPLDDHLSSGAVDLLLARLRLLGDQLAEDATGCGAGYWR